MATHQLKADSVLKEWMFEKPPLVDKGDVVMILAPDEHQASLYTDQIEPSLAASAPLVGSVR